MPALLAAVLFVAACGEDEMSSPETPTNASSGTPVAAPSREDGTLNGTPAGNEATATLAGLLARGLEITYMVTYQTTSPEGGEGDRYVVFNRPPLTRIDTIPADSSEPSSLVTGGANMTTVSCTGGPDDWECFEIEPLGDSLLVAAGPFVYLSASDLESFDVSEMEERTFAGQAARCFRLIPRQRETGGDIEYCLNRDGVPLYGAPLLGTVEATEFSPDVSDEDFVSPAEPQR